MRRPLTVKVTTARTMLDCGKTTIFKLMKSGTLERVYIDGIPRITMESIERVTQSKKTRVSRVALENTRPAGVESSGRRRIDP
jgi:hypothetical protein